ncbi:MAG TPA: class I SAM-dependent methyltransferase [Casimicrobiaceae bacterium]|jgi:SAM-dependent methyltransferase|nr:class I SAM-dependent methyltransferase [Casimicrobiaceae bacterium]
MNDPHPVDAATLVIRAAYDAVDYDCTAYPQSHPDRLRTIARVFGVDAPPVATARVLEVGCGDGSNVIPIADAFPQATFVGCDLAPRAIEKGRALIAEAGLSNVALHCQDLRELPASLGEFDYVIAHGFYSWVPPPVRDALMTLLATRMSPAGVAFVSYNTLPGNRVRQIAEDAMHWHTRDSTSAAETLRASRELLTMMGAPGLTQWPADAALRAEFTNRAGQTDSVLYHDDLAQPNDAVYFHEFAAHAERHGLAYIGDSDVRLMSGGGLAPEVRKFVMRFDRIAREQYLDFMRMRRFRQSLLTRAASATGFNLDAARIDGVKVTVASTLMQSMAEAERMGQPRESAFHGGSPMLTAMVMWLAELAPRAMESGEVARWHADHAKAGAPPLASLLAEAWVGGVIDLHSQPAALTTSIAPRPRASRIARHLAQSRTRVVNVRHESVSLTNPAARKLLTLLDGTRDRATLERELGPASEPGAPGVDAMLQAFARLALLVP